MYSTLSQFIAALESAGELVRVKAKVSPILEVAEIADRISKSPCPHVSEYARAFDPDHCDLGGKAILFENVEGSTLPLLINAFGSYHRMEMALGCDEKGHTPGGFEALAARIEKLIKPQPPVGIIEKMKKGLELIQIAAVAPKTVRSGRCQEIVRTGADIDLLSLPILKCWPLDGNLEKVGYPTPAGQPDAAPGGGRYITFAGIHTIHPEDAGKEDGQPRPSRNIGMYRAQVIDKTRTAMHWHMHHDGARHWRAWKKYHAENPGKLPGAGGMPCALVFGGESVLPYAATAPLPPGVSELLMAGFLNRSGIELVKCKTIDLHVPANAEIVIEGYVSTDAAAPGYDPRLPNAGLLHGQPLAAPQSLRSDGLSPVSQASSLKSQAFFEGPFGDHTGFYSLPDRYPIFTVTAITHAKQAIYPTTLVGPPPQEDYYLGKATERVFLPLLKMLVPDIIDYHLPQFGCFHNVAFIKIRKEYPLQARRVMHAIWGAGQMAWTKMIVVVDEDVNVHDEQSVLFHLAANCDPGRDIEIVSGPLDILDHAAPHLGAGHKIGFDATRKINGEQVNGHPVRDFPPIVAMDEITRKLVSRRWKEYGL